MASGRGGLWGWVQDVGKSCGFAQAPQQPAMWVRANPELFPQEVPGMGEDILAATSQPGGSLEEKIQMVTDTFRMNARHLESLQQVLRKRALERREKAGEPQLPPEVEHVVSDGTYLDAFLEAYDGQVFELYSDEVVPCHAYRLALEVHSGGAYWSSIPVQEAGAVRHKVETVSASSSHEGSASIVSQFGAAQRGAVFVWRWQHLLDRGPYSIPEWLSRALAVEGNDPLRKLLSELEVIRRWEQKLRQETCVYVRQGTEVKDPYIKEVLRLWPSETDNQGVEQLKKCAWVEGLDPRLFVGRLVLVHRVRYDASHSLGLHAQISKRHSEESGPPESNPPYRLATTWQWAAPSGEAAAGATATGGGLAGTAASLSSTFSELSRPGASRPDTQLSRPGTDGGPLTRPGTAMSEVTRPGTTGSQATQPGEFRNRTPSPLPLKQSVPVSAAAAAPGTPPAVAYIRAQEASQAAEAASAAYRSAGYIGTDGATSGPTALPPPPPPVAPARSC